MDENTCKSCFKTADMEPVEVKRDGKWVASSVRRCANPECHAVREGTLEDRLDHIRSVYGYKYFGDYELSPAQLDAVWEAKTLAERVPALLEALEPFEVVADVISPELPDNTEVEVRVRGLPVYYLALGSLRAARLARAKAEGRA